MLFRIQCCLIDGDNSEEFFLLEKNNVGDYEIFFQ
jgi:hypothetical protein